MRQLLKWILVGVCCCVGMTLNMACTEEADCTDTTRPSLNLTFYSFVPDTLPDGDIKDSLVLIAWDTLTITAFETDSVIINKDVSVSSVSLPLRYASETTTLVLHYTDSLRDTLTVQHHNTPYFLNMDCGYQMKQDLIDVMHTSTLLDSIIIKEHKVGIYGTENLALYY